MDNFFRVCVAGRYYDIPTQELSPPTLEALKSITDASNNINPRDLLRVFLESQEINIILKDALEATSRRIAQELATHEQAKNELSS